MTSILSIAALPPATAGAGNAGRFNSVDDARAQMLAEVKARQETYLTPQEAFRSGAELGPPSGKTLRSSNHPSKVHTEVKVDGKVVARVYNGGGVEIAKEYAFLHDEIGFANDTGAGPDLATDRANRIKAALQSHGAVMQDELSPAGLATAQLAQKPVLELLRANTAQTQDEWLEDQAKQGPLDPGTFFSRVA
ncbi:MAG: hypothetical protein K9G60_08640 [Pseudolabrys sp.]|nr:hypothetical protein [Pseudolabrys sp.]